jgi:DNA-binding transcriptional LysR family regulator
VGEGAVGRLAIGFVPSAMNDCLPELLRRFRRHYPEVELGLREMTPDAVLRAVRDRRLDLGLLYRPIADPDLAQRLLATERLLLALPAGHPAATSNEVTLHDVRDEPFVLPERHDVPGIHAAVTATFADAGIAPPTAQRGVWLMQTVLGLVAAGIGLAVVPSSVAVSGRHGVVLRSIRDSRHRVELAAVWRADSDSAPLAGLLALEARTTHTCM